MLQLGNVLAIGVRVGPKQVESALKCAGIDPRRRAETLTMQEWGRLYAKSRGLLITN
jgi:hypothetical protein